MVRTKPSPLLGQPSYPLPHISPRDSRLQGVSDPSGIGLGAFLQSQQAKELSPKAIQLQDTDGGRDAARELDCLNKA